MKTEPTKSESQYLKDVAYTKERLGKIYGIPADRMGRVDYNRMGQIDYMSIGLKVHNPYGHIVMNDQDGFGSWIMVRKPNPHWWKFYVGLLLILAVWAMVMVGLFFATVYLLNWLSQFPGFDTGMAPIVGLYDGLAILVISGIAWDWVGELPSGRRIIETEKFITK